MSQDECIFRTETWARARVFKTRRFIFETSPDDVFQCAGGDANSAADAHIPFHTSSSPSLSTAVVEGQTWQPMFSCGAATVYTARLNYLAQRFTSRTNWPVAPGADWQVGYLIFLGPALFSPSHSILTGDFNDRTSGLAFLLKKKFVQKIWSILTSFIPTYINCH